MPNLENPFWEWVPKPPPVQNVGHLSKGEYRWSWVEFAATCHANPGRWAKVKPLIPDAGIAHRLRREHGLETHTSREVGGLRVYARSPL